MTGRRLLPARLLSWYPKAAIGSGVLESLTAHGNTESEKRLLRLVRLKASFSVSCSFCIDMNSAEYDSHGISEEEFNAIKNNFTKGYPKSLTDPGKNRYQIRGTHLVNPFAIYNKFYTGIKKRVYRKRNSNACGNRFPGKLLGTSDSITRNSASGFFRYIRKIIFLFQSGLRFGRKRFRLFKRSRNKILVDQPHKLL